MSPRPGRTTRGNGERPRKEDLHNERRKWTELQQAEDMAYFKADLCCY
jgi:hypothetical protein